LQVNRAGHDARFDLPPDEVPYGSIALALFLTVFGATAFVLAWLHFTQQIFGKEQAVSWLAGVHGIVTSEHTGMYSSCMLSEAHSVGVRQ
jgi:hypothetical protein